MEFVGDFPALVRDFLELVVDFPDRDEDFLVPDGDFAVRGQEFAAAGVEEDIGDILLDEKFQEIAGKCREIFVELHEIALAGRDPSASARLQDDGVAVTCRTITTADSPSG